MIKLTRGQKIVLWTSSAPMAAVGVAGAIATFVNMQNVLTDKATALGMVAAGEGATLICALVTLALTLMGQHTPAVVRAGLWLLPVAASGSGMYLASDANHAVAMGFTPLAMTAAGEGIALVARRIVAFQTGTDLEQQRRSGLLLWHANRAANGGVIGRRLSKAAVWRLTRAFATTDDQMSVQLGQVQRFRIGEGADANLAAVLSGTKTPKPQRAVKAPEPLPELPELPELPSLPAASPQAVTEAPMAPKQLAPAETDARKPAFTPDGDTGYDFVKGVLAEAEDRVKTDGSVKLLTVAEVAAIKGVATGTVRSWVNRGKLAVADRDDDGRSLFHPLTVADLD